MGTRAPDSGDMEELEYFLVLYETAEVELDRVMPTALSVREEDWRLSNLEEGRLSAREEGPRMVASELRWEDDSRESQCEEE